MKSIASYRHHLVLALLTGLAAWGVSTSAYGQANLSFSGGSGTPLTITLNQTVTFTITTAAANTGVVFQGVGDIFAGGMYRASGSIPYQVDSGFALSLAGFESGFTAGSITAMDVFAYADNWPAVKVGDVVTLKAGTVTTNSNYTAPAPISGSYDAFIYEEYSGGRVSLNGVSVVPEPSAWAMCSLGASLLALTLRRRRSHA